MATSFCRYDEGSLQGCPDPDVAADRCEAWSRADREGVASSAGKGRGVPEGVPVGSCRGEVIISARPSTDLRDGSHRAQDRVRLSLAGSGMERRNLDRRHRGRPALGLLPFTEEGLLSPCLIDRCRQASVPTISFGYFAQYQ